MNDTYVVVVANVWGYAPEVYGPFDTEVEAREWLAGATRLSNTGSVSKVLGREHRA